MKSLEDEIEEKISAIYDTEYHMYTNTKPYENMFCFLVHNTSETVALLDITNRKTVDETTVELMSTEPYDIKGTPLSKRVIVYLGPSQVIEKHDTLIHCVNSEEFLNDAVDALA